MISGSVTPARDAVVPLTLRGSSGQEREIVAEIDTGFDGYLTLPAALAAALGLRRRAPIQAVLADGTRTELEVLDATVQWDGGWRRIAAVQVEGGCLVGMSLLYGHRLTIDVVDGGPVTIDRLP